MGSDVGEGSGEKRGQDHRKEGLDAAEEVTSVPLVYKKYSTVLLKTMPGIDNVGTIWMRDM